MSKTARKIKIPIYERYLRVIVNHDIDAVLEYMGHADDDDPIEATVIVDEQDVINLVIRPDANLNTICHEAFHVTSEILSSAGLKLSNKSEEAYAYLIGYVGELIEKEIDKYHG